MATRAGSPFGNLLHRYRRAAGLTQEQLAERAGLSVRGVSDIERGLKQAPHRYTVQVLADALQLSADERAALEAAIPRRRGPLARSTLRDAMARDTQVHSHAVSVHITIPLQATRFIGREREVSEVCAILEREDLRLLTLTGAGGTGKTRLAVEVARRLAPRFPDGIVFVGLAALADPALVAATIAATLDLKEAGSRSILDIVSQHLKGKRLLLMLDNFEHLLPAVSVVSHLLVACPRLTILVTSRAVLHLSAEHEYPVPPMGLVDPGHFPDLAGLSRNDAVALFVERAQAIKPGFAITAENATAAAEICRRVDGLPLAIELAAARVRVLPLPALLARLQDRLQFLTAGPHDLPARQRTMRDTIAWSYDLLDRQEQYLFRRLAVFVGGFNLEAAESICDESAASHILDGVTSLVDKHLLTVQEQADGEPRFGMLETIREYGLERLAAEGEEAQVRDQHQAHFLRLAEEAEPRLNGPEQRRWLARLDMEHDNLRAALRWSGEREADERGLRLAAALWHFWEWRGLLNEGRSLLETALAGAASAPAGARAAALHATGRLAYRQGDFSRALALNEEALALRRALGDRPAIATSLNSLAIAVERHGDYERAAALHEEALSLRRDLGDTYGVSVTLNNLGIVAEGQGDYGRAVALHEESLALSRALGNKQGIAYSLANLGDVAYMQGDYPRAATLHEEALALRRELGDKHGIAASLDGLGMATYRQGDFQRSMIMIQESLELGRDIDARDLMAKGLECLAWVAAAQRRLQRAARLGGAAEALRESLAVPLLPEQREGHDHMLSAMQMEMDAEACAAAWAAGRSLPPEEAIAMALQGGSMT